MAMDYVDNHGAMEKSMDIICPPTFPQLPRILEVIHKIHSHYYGDYGE